MKIYFDENRMKTKRNRKQYGTFLFNQKLEGKFVTGLKRRYIYKLIETTRKALGRTQQIKAINISLSVR